MKINRLSKLLLAAVIAALCAIAITACSQEDEQIEEELQSDTGLTGGIAATVNGTEIEEDRVTRAINNTRINNSLTEESEWKDYLEKRKYTVESMRDEILGQLIDQELVLQCAEQRGVTTDDEEIQSYVDKMKSQYSSEEAWLTAVDEAGWDDENAYKEALRYSILEKKLRDGFTAETENNLQGAALLEELKTSAPGYTGAKRTAHILFNKDDVDLANEVREKLENGEISFQDAVAEYSIDEETKANGGDVGWSNISSYVTEYQDAITELEQGQISEVTESKYGQHIIMVTDVWNAPEEITSIDQVPTEIVDYIKENSVSSKSSTAFDDWLVALHPMNTIVINPMPENVPYYVDMSGVYSEEEMQEINEKAERKLITGTEEAAEEATAEEAAADAAAEEAAADEGAADADAAATDAAATDAAATD